MELNKKKSPTSIIPDRYGLGSACNKKRNDSQKKKKQNKNNTQTTKPKQRIRNETHHPKK